MAHRPGRIVLALAAVAVLLACGAPVAQAHEGRLAVPIAPAVAAPVSVPAPDAGPSQTISGMPSAPVIPFVLVAVLVAGASLTVARAPRRLVALAIVPLIVLVMFETGVHGVHHLGDPRAAGQCSVAVSAEHVAGAVVDGPADVAPIVFLSAAVVLPDSPPYLGRHHRPDTGRAPPAPSA